MLPPANILSKEQVEFFLREGYVIVRDVYSVSEVIALRNFFKEKFDNNFWKISEFNSATVINDIYLHFPHLTDSIIKPAFIGAVKDILGSEIVCIPECCVHHNRYYDWHRDTTSLESTGETIHLNTADFLIQCSVYLQDNTPEGGGLTLVPKSNVKKDRFIQMHYGNFAHRVRNKILKLFHRSAFHVIERTENPVDVPTKAGDLLLFNNQLDHRATFKRGKDARPVVPAIEKFAVFNTFCRSKTLAAAYLKSLQAPDEPYAKFLRQASLAPALIQKAKELDFSLSYSNTSHDYSEALQQRTN